ncbi:flagellar biosynthetic protein FliO, partial [Nocardioides kribbensis]
MAELALRMVVSLAVVVGLLLLIARLGARRFSGRAGAAVQVLHRQQLGRGSALTVVTVGGRTLVLGTTEQQVRVLAELDADEAATVAGQDGAPLDPGTTDGDREDVTTRSPRLATVTALPSLSVVPAPADEPEPATEQPEQTSRTDLGDPVDHRSEGRQQQGTAVTVVTDDAAPVPSAPAFPAAPAVLPALGEQPGPYAGHAAAILGRLAPAGASAGVGPRPTDEATVGTAAEPAHDLTGDLTGGPTGGLTAPDAAVDAGSLAAAAVSGRHRSDHPALTGPAPAAAFEPVRPDPTAPRVVARHRVATTAPALGAAATPVAPALAAPADVPAVVPAVLPATGPEVVPAPPLGAAPATVSGLPAPVAVAVPAVNPAELLLAQETATDATTTTGIPLGTAGTATAASTPGPATAAPAADDFAAQLAAWLADPTPLTPTAADATGTATTGATPGTEAPAAGPGRATRAERRTARGLVRRA